MLPSTMARNAVFVMDENTVSAMVVHQVIVNPSFVADAVIDVTNILVKRIIQQ